MYEYKLVNEHSSSNKYGKCEICKKEVDNIYYQIEYKKYKNGYFVSGDKWGHKDCLINARVKEEL